MKHHLNPQPPEPGTSAPVVMCSRCLQHGHGAAEIAHMRTEECSHDPHRRERKLHPDLEGRIERLEDTLILICKQLGITPPDLP